VALAKQQLGTRHGPINAISKGIAAAPSRSRAGRGSHRDRQIGSAHGASGQGRDPDAGGTRLDADDGERGCSVPEPSHRLEIILIDQDSPTGHGHGAACDDQRQRAERPGPGSA
jgi:hypothetical protein